MAPREVKMRLNGDEYQAVLHGLVLLVRAEPLDSEMERRQQVARTLLAEWEPVDYGELACGFDHPHPDHPHGTPT